MSDTLMDLVKRISAGDEEFFSLLYDVNANTKEDLKDIRMTVGKNLYFWARQHKQYAKDGLKMTHNGDVDGKKIVMHTMLVFSNHMSQGNIIVTMEVDGVVTPETTFIEYESLVDQTLCRGVNLNLETGDRCEWYINEECPKLDKVSNTVVDSMSETLKNIAMFARDFPTVKPFVIHMYNPAKISLTGTVPYKNGASLSFTKGASIYVSRYYGRRIVFTNDGLATFSGHI